MTLSNFYGPKAIACMARIEAYLHEVSPLTAAEIGAHVGIPTDLTSNYLAHMRREELVMIAPKLKKGRGIRMWQLGVDPDLLALAERERLPNRPVLTTWQPCAVIDPWHLPEAFFHPERVTP